MKKLIGMIVLAAAVPALAFDLAKPGVVQIPANALESTKLAATELTNYVAKVTGMEFPVDAFVSNASKKGVKSSPDAIETIASTRGSIVIGTVDTLGAAVPEAAKKALDATDNDEAAWAGVVNGTLWFVGKDETAELFMVYHFIEEKLGVSWFRAWEPEDPGEYVPDLRKVKKWKGEGVEWCDGKLTLSDDFAEFRQPRFRVRRLDRTGSWSWPLPVNGTACATRNGFQVYPAYGGFVPDDPKNPLYQSLRPRCNHKKCTTGGHSIFNYAIPGKKYFADHPEYFAMVDGKRVRNGQHCLSNPNIARLMTEYFIEFYEKTGGIGQLAFGSVDSAAGSCECPECRKLDPRPGDMSRRFFLVVDAVSRAVLKRYPKADLSTWAYANYRDLPKDIQFDPRLKLEFCDHNRCYAHAIDDPSCFRNVETLRMMQGCKAKFPFMWIYDYFSSSGAPYVCFEEVMAHDLKVYDKMGISGWKSEWSYSDGYFGGNTVRRGPAHDDCRSNWQWLYMTGKLLWDPNLDWRKIVDDAEKKYYGVAYKPMKKYHDLRRKLWAETPACMGYPNSDERRPLIFNKAGAKEELFKLLDEADRLLNAAEYRLFSSNYNTETWDPQLVYLHHRLAEDRRNLERYWVKANENYREIQKKILSAYPLKKPIVVDGKDDEWEGVKEFEGLCGLQGVVRGPIPETHKTTMKIAYDKDGLYVFFKAREPDGDPVVPKPGGDAWDGEGIEFFMKAPTADNLVYHFIANPDGRVWACDDRNGVSATAFGAKVKSVWSKEGWTLELAIPAKNTAVPEPGATWKVNLGRNRVSHRNHAVGWSFTMDGIAYADSSKFRPVKMEK